LNEKLKKEFEKFEDIYGNILQNIYGVTKETGISKEKEKQQAVIDWRN